MTVVFSLLGCSIAICAAEIVFTWFIGHITDDTEEYFSAWMFSCILNSAIIAYSIICKFGMFG